MERKLATIRRISNIEPIEGADKIELCTIDNWKVVTAKDVGHKVGDLVVYCEIDSFLPVKPEFEWLRKSSYKKLSDGSEGFRIKTIRLRGQISQGLIIPLKEIPPSDNPAQDIWLIDQDVTERLGITKYDPPLPDELLGKAKGYFPSHTSKTSQDRVQNLTKDWDKYKDNIYYITEKLNGESFTFYINNGEYGVCSKEVDFLESNDNIFWKISKKLDLINKLREFGYNIALQGELIGECIQGNPYKIKGKTVKFFNIFDIDKQEYFPLQEFKDLMFGLDLETVPIIDEEYKLPETIDELILVADGKSALNPEFNREGIVVRSLDSKISFKVISNKFLLNSGD